MRILLRFMAAALITSVGQTQNPSDVSFVLGTKGARTQFRAGEAVDLELQFSSRAAGQYSVWTTNTTRTVRQPKYDHFVVEPAGGGADPLWDMFAQIDDGFGGMPRTPTTLGAQPVIVNVALNEWLSIRQPGHYRITAETTRVATAGLPSAGLNLTSNTIEIDVAAPETGWAASQLQQAVATLIIEDPQPVVGQHYDDPRRRGEQAEQAGRILRFLETEQAVPPLARFFESANTYAQAQLRAGLFASPYRQEIMAAMEKELVDPDRPVTYYYLATLAELEQIRVLGPTPLYTAKSPEEIKRWTDEVELPRREQAQLIEDQYFAKLAEAIKNKRGQALAVSLNTLVSRGPQAAPDVLKALIDNFTALPETIQNTLLTTSWSRIASPAMEPLLRSLASSRSSARDGALLRLQEIDPAAARPIALERIRQGDLVLNAIGQNPRALLSLPDRILPELDNALVTALEHQENVDLLIGRYASGSALPRIRAFADRALDSSCDPGLLAYFFRVDPEYAASLVYASRARQPAACTLNLGGLEDLLTSPGLERQAIADLSSDDLGVRRAGETFLQNAGSPTAEGPLWEAMARVRASLPGPNDQRDFLLAEALTKAPGWTLRPEKIDRLAAACVTENCRRDAQAVRRDLTEPIAISVDDQPNTFARIGTVMPHSHEQFAQKIAQFPKGTRFSVDGARGTWYGSRRKDEIRQILEAAGMRLVDPAPAAVR